MPSIPMIELYQELKDLHKSKVTDFADALATAERLHNTKLRFDKEDFQIVNEKGFNRAQCLTGGRNSGRQSNKAALLRHFSAAAPLMPEHLRQKAIIKMAEIKVASPQLPGIIAEARQLQADTQAEQEELFKLWGTNREEFYRQTKEVKPLRR